MLRLCEVESRSRGPLAVLIRDHQALAAHLPQRPQTDIVRLSAGLESLCVGV